MGHDLRKKILARALKIQLRKNLKRKHEQEINKAGI